MSEGWVTLLQQQWGLKVWGHEIEHQNHLYSFAWRLYSWQLAIMFSIINVSNNYKMDHSYNDNDSSSPFKQNSIWKYACWRLSVTNQKFSSAEGHKHEGGASSIVFHRPHPPGETFFLLTHEKRKWLKKMKFWTGGPWRWCWRVWVCWLQGSWCEGQREKGKRSRWWRPACWGEDH